MWPDAKLCFVQHKLPARKRIPQRYIIPVYHHSVCAKRTAGVLPIYLNNVGVIPAYLHCVCDECIAKVSPEPQKENLAWKKENIKWHREDQQHHNV